MKSGAVFALLVILTAAAAHGASLTGTWTCNDGGTYFIRQNGNDVWWLGRSADGGASWTNVFHGTIDGDIVEGLWSDVPLGAERQNGELDLQIASDDHLTRTRQTGNFAGREWTRGEHGERDGARQNPTDRDTDRGAEGTRTSTSPSEYRGRNGLRLSYECPPNPSGNVYGTDIYTDDSSVCNAAIHAGMLNRAGGMVTIEIRPGLESYQGTLRHGIPSASYARWGGSYVFIGSQALAPGPRRVELTTAPAEYRGQIGQRLIYACPPNPRGRVYGTDVYTDDSDVCAAAVHAGVIRMRDGSVTIEIRAGRSSYKGTTRNGITSDGYGEWSGSFVFARE
jgi:hypothetical protein